jgi:glycosyltransferase involved in cell wall biosynthesis
MPNAPAGDGGFPRVLFITPAAFNHLSGGGITFTNLFRGWPNDRLATVHNDATPVATDVCQQFYRLGEREINTWPILAWFRSRESSPTTAEVGSGPGIARSAPHLIKTAVFGDGLPEHGRLSPELESWIAEFRPELIYTILGSSGMMELIERIQLRFRLPLVVHFMDDWQSAIHRGGLLSPLQRRRMQALIARLVASARVRLGICDAMCTEYARRFGQPFLSFQNTIDTARWAPLAERDRRVGSPTRVLYAGSVLGFAQADSLAECCAAVATLRHGGMQIGLDIYSPPAQTAPLRDRLVCNGAIRLHDVISDDASYFRSLASADILLLPVNFDAHSVRYIRLSMPTKVPSYLVSGTPTLVYGPAEVAQVEYARTAGWGFIVDGRGVNALADAITRLATDEALRERLSATARRFAVAYHDASRVRSAFQTVLARAAAA